MINMKKLMAKYIISLEKIDKNQNIVSERLLDSYLKIDMNDDFWNSNFLGFSYIKSSIDVVDVEDKEKNCFVANKEKKVFSSVFRNINVSFEELSLEERRRALYWLKPELNLFFMPDCFNNIYINGKKADFVRSLAFVSEAYQILLKDDRVQDLNVAKGYGRIKKLEMYIEKYVYDVCEDKNSIEFGQFSKIFPKPLTSIEMLSGQLKKIGLKKMYNNLIEFDYFVFGLVYWVLFKGRQICCENENKKNLNDVIEDAVKQHQCQTGQLKSLREREIIKIYKNI